jgi:hypothetical protein
MKSILAEFFERDLNKLINEVNAFGNEADLWKVKGDIKNPAGNLVLHIIGGTNYLIGNVLGGTGYVRNRAAEFADKDIEAAALIVELKKLIVVVTSTLDHISPEDMEKEYPIFFDKPGATTGYVLTQLLLHLNYHLGQVNYLRRILE